MLNKRKTESNFWAISLHAVSFFGGGGITISFVL
jgi:hypothetical protein